MFFFIVGIIVILVNHLFFYKGLIPLVNTDLYCTSSEIVLKFHAGSVKSLSIKYSEIDSVVVKSVYTTGLVSRYMVHIKNKCSGDAHIGFLYSKVLRGFTPEMILFLERIKKEEIKVISF